MGTEQDSSEALERQAGYVLDEARMVLPGIQALFGFQLIAVFSDRFESALTEVEQGLHLGAIALVTLAIGLIMAPAAYHRQAEHGRVTRRFIDLASKLLTSAMVPLMLAIVGDVYLVSRVIAGGLVLPLAVALGVLACLGWLWFVWPRR